MKSLDEATEAELRAELEERAKRRIREENERVSKEHRELLENVDLLLGLTPEHSRKSCSDVDPCNYGHSSGVPRCTRCALLDVKSEEHNSNLVAYVEIRVRELM